MLKTVIFAIFLAQIEIFDMQTKATKIWWWCPNHQSKWSSRVESSTANLILRGWRKGELWVIGVVPTTNPPMLKLERLEWEKKVLEYQWVWTRVFCCTFVGVRYLYIYLPLFHSRWGVLLMEAWMGYL